LTLSVPEENMAYAQSFYAAAGIGEDEPVLGIVSSASEPTRCWPPEKFAAVASYFHHKYGMHPVCFGSKGDAATIEKVAAACDAPVIVEDFERGNILDSAALMQRCSVMVGNISGPLHIADALGVPCVGIYGPHPPGRFGLLGKRVSHVCLNLDCAPCDTPDCEHRRCVNDITVESVANAIDEVLRSR